MVPWSPVGYTFMTKPGRSATTKLDASLLIINVTTESMAGNNLTLVEVAIGL